MKLKYILATFSIAALAFAFTGCGGDDADPAFKSNVTVDGDRVEMEPGDSRTVSITAGGGGYRIRVYDEKIATATLSGNKLTVTGVASGQTGVLITDADGANQYVHVLIFGDLILDRNSLTMTGGYRMLNVVNTASFEIEKGNGEYYFTSDNQDISIVFDGKDATVTAYDYFEDALVTIWDRGGRSAEIIITATDPYLSIKNNNTLQYYYTSAMNNSSSYYTPENFKTGNTYTFNCYYSWSFDPDVPYFSLKFSADDLQPGSKGEGRLTFSTTVTDAPVDVYVLKNDGDKVWIIYHHQYNATTRREGRVIQEVF